MKEREVELKREVELNELNIVRLFVILSFVAIIGIAYAYVVSLPIEIEIWGKVDGNIDLTRLVNTQKIPNLEINGAEFSLKIKAPYFAIAQMFGIK